MSRVAALRSRTVRLPLRSALRWGKRSELTELEHVLVRIDSDDGAFGVAEAPVRPTIYGETPEGIAAVLRRVLAPELVGADLDDDEALERALTAVPFNHAARGALDVALRSARAMAAGRSLYQSYRGPQAHLRVSYILGIDTPAAMAAEAERVVAQGVSVFKVEVGRDGRRDEDALDAVGRALAGSGALLYADASEAYSAAEAPHRLERLRAMGVLWVEEPLPVERLRERAELRRLAVLPIIADDSCLDPRDLDRELDFDTFDILNIKPARSGYGASLRMMARAHEAGKGVMIGSQAASGLGTVHAAILASHREVTHPSELSSPLRLERDTLGRPLPYRDGVLAVADLAEASLRPELLTGFAAD